MSMDLSDSIEDAICNYMENAEYTWLERREIINSALKSLLDAYPTYELKDGEFITEGEGRDYFNDNDVDYDFDLSQEVQGKYEERLMNAGWSPQVDVIRHGLDDPWVYWITRPANPNSEEDGVDEFVYITHEFKTTGELNEWLLSKGY